MKNPFSTTSTRGGRFTRGSAAAVVNVIHIRFDPTSPKPWLMRSTTCERRLSTFSGAMQAAIYAAAVTRAMGRQSVICARDPAGHAETFDASELNMRVQASAA